MRTGLLLILAPWVLLAMLVFAGCASALPTRVVDGIAIYERPAETVAAYCYSRLSAEERNQPHIYGCYTTGEMIMVEEGHPEVLAHELRHAQGWEHRGPCHSSEAHPDGLKPDGSPCDWYRSGR
jgi:hypothetical protein